MHIDKTGHQRRVITEIDDLGVILPATGAKIALPAKRADSISAQRDKSMIVQLRRNTVK